MRKIQKIIIIFYGLLVVIACIYVPWVVDSNSGYRFQFLGFSFIWQPIMYMHYDWNLKLVPILGVTIIYIKGLILELIALTALFGGLYALTLGTKKEEENNKKLEGKEGEEK